MFGSWNKNLKIWHGMKLFLKKSRLYLFKGRSEQSRATYQNASPNQFINFVQRFINYRTSSLRDNFSDFFPRFENFKFFCILIIELPNNFLKIDSLSFCFSSNLTSKALRDGEK